MALPKKGSRKVTVDGVQYRYVVGSAGFKNDSIVVQAAAGPGQKLVVELDFNIEYAGGIARPILPGFVAKLIRAASAAQWTPQSAGSTYEVSLRELLPDHPPPPHRHGLLMDRIEIQHPTHGELLFECSEGDWKMSAPRSRRAEAWAIWEAMEFLSAPPYERPAEEAVNRLLADFDPASFIKVKAHKSAHTASRYTDELSIGPSDGRRTLFRFQCWPERNYVATGDWRSVFDRSPEDWLA